MSNYNINNTGNMDHLSEFKIKDNEFINFVRKPFDALRYRSIDAAKAVSEHWNDPVGLAAKCATGVYDIAKNGLFSHPKTKDKQMEQFVKHGEMKAMSDAYIRYVSNTKPDDNGFDKWMKKSAMVIDVTLSQMAMRPLESLKKVALAGTLAMLATAVIHNAPGADIVGINPNPDMSCIAQSIDKNLESGNTLQSVLTSGAAGTALSIVPDIYKSCVNQDGFHSSFGQFVDVLDKAESAMSSPIGAGKLINEAITSVKVNNAEFDYGDYPFSGPLEQGLLDSLDKGPATETAYLSSLGPEQPTPIEVNFNQLQAILPPREEKVEKERDYAIEMTV